MAVKTSTMNSTPGKALIQEYPLGNSSFDWTMASLSGWIIGGLYLDGWAHSHGKVDDVFLTPWHAILYSGVLLTFIFLLFHLMRNVSKGYDWRKSLPQGYFLSLAGAVLFLLGGGLDFIWHTLFGIEVNLETLLSPTHLLLATSGVLMISGPLRAAWAQSAHPQRRGWKALGPSILSATLVLSVVTFFTQFAHPISEPRAVKVTTPDQGQAGDIYLMNANGTGQMRLSASPNMSAWSSDWSPDGRQIVFTRGEITTSENPESALYLMNADGSELKQLTDMPGQEFVPAWSPDGRRIAFVSKIQDQQKIYVINSDGSHLEPLTGDSVLAYGPVWSPDGTRILYTSNATGRDQLYAMNADGSQPVQLTSKGIYNWGAVWSPDGSRIAFSSSRDGNDDIYVIQADGSKELRLTQDPETDNMPAWSPDGRQIAFVAWRDDRSDIYAMDADGSNAHNLTNNHALEILFPKWSPDGTMIMFTATGHTTLPNPFASKSLAIASLLLQSAVLMGVVLMLVQSWRLPFGALTFMFTLNGLLMGVFNSNYILALSMLIAGVAADSMLWRLNPAAEQAGRFSFFAFSVPVFFTASYFLIVQITQGMDWSIHLWLGTIFMTGIVGLFLGLLIVKSRGEMESPRPAGR